MLENTSIAAVTLPGDVRNVYFQESTGAFRRASYSAQANTWDASVRLNSQGFSQPKNNTPLAAVNFKTLPKNNTPLPAVVSDLYSGATSMLIRRTQSPETILLFVNSENHTLDCVNLGPLTLDDCSLFENMQSKLLVSPLSPHISATVLVADTDQAGLLLIYQDPSARTVVMLGYVSAATNNDWIWRNETAKVGLQVSATDPVVVVACNAQASKNDLTDGDFALVCFTKRIAGSDSSGFTNFIEPFSINVNKTSPADLAFQSS